jgi:hypothetical protein
MGEIMEETLTVTPTPFANKLRTQDGRMLAPPEGWELLPPGDAGLTRRVKEAGPSWTVLEKRGRKSFSRGVWAPAENIAAARKAVEARRSTPAYAREMERAAARRERVQQEYEGDFERAVLGFLRFSARHAELARRLASAVAAHATPVGSGTVARTARLTVEERAEAAVLAWMRHQTTGYDSMRIERVKGRRREVRRELNGISRSVLALHRRDEPHAAAGCPLCSLLAG